MIVAFYALFMTVLWVLMSYVALKAGNAYNQVACVFMALAFWSGCSFLVLA